jgi:predicted enzyme related to lactoylglutathione lyase
MASSEPLETRPRPGDVCYASLWLPDVDRAAAFFGEVLGWRFAPAADPRSRSVTGVNPRLGLWRDPDRIATFLNFAVNDVDAAAARVRAAGGTAGEPAEEPYGRIADCVDDQGLPFALYELTAETATPVAPSEHGELSYLVFEMPDPALARAFYGAVLGWTFTPGRAENGWNVEDIWPLAGIGPRPGSPAVVPLYTVDDVEAAVERVRALGGTATDPARQQYGITAECTDGLGTRFYLAQY